MTTSSCKRVRHISVSGVPLNREHIAHMYEPTSRLHVIDLPALLPQSRRSRLDSVTPVKHCVTQSVQRRLQ